MRFGIAAKLLHGFAHGGQIDDCGYAGKVLQKHTRGHERRLFLRSVRRPLRKRTNVVGVNEAAVFTAQKIFQEDAEREGKSGDGAQALLFQFFEAINFEGLCADIELIARVERVCCGNRHSLLPFGD